MLDNLASPRGFQDRTSAYFGKIADLWDRNYRGAPVRDIDARYDLRNIEALRSLGYLRQSRRP